MVNIYFLEEYAKMRQNAFEEKARLARLIQELKAQKPRIWQNLTWKVGNWSVETFRRPLRL